MVVPVFRISDPDLLPGLLEELTARRDCLAEVILPDTLLVSLLGSYNAEALEQEIGSRIRAWQAIQRHTDVEVTVEPVRTSGRASKIRAEMDTR